ncbi:hypothetical protein DAPPUDRAFT_117463 [Daphnia pulex]|uniref:Uncharacterized protein n=1 Tax=Daphnia pulex TaxID=6669 RepID=E9HSR3_DAPPU|nr:hypothetical protein DAPPUDRAFT_117463 [Daphnia pulex]|eukprot:EFX65221.1 hypothetical protein DAPPUDRAFT_117463 [Daphnia pulex]
MATEEGNRAVGKKTEGCRGCDDDCFGARAEPREGGSSSPWSTGAGSGAAHGTAACSGPVEVTVYKCSGYCWRPTAAGITGTRRRRKRRFRWNTRPAGVLTR